MKRKITRILALCALFCSGQMYAQLTPEVLYYKFDGTGTTVPNLASSPPIGTATANLMGSLTQGASSLCRGSVIGSGNSSTTDYVNTGWAPNLGAGSWSISFRTANIGPSATLFYIFGDANTASFRCFTNGVAGPNNWILRGAGLTDVYVNGGATTAAHMTTFVYDNTLGNVKGYLDGVLVTTVAQGAVNMTGTGPLKVVGYATNVGMPAGGNLDEFRFYSRALSAAEVTQLYNPFTPTGYLGSDFSMCPGNPAALNINWPASTVLWSTAETTDAISINTPGTYSVQVSGVCGTGNDTIVVGSLQTTNSITASSCGNYTAPSGATLSASGTYMDTIPNSLACDSIITINLTVNMPSSSSMTVTECSGTYTAPSGATFTTSGTYADIIPNAVGCDSTITIDLTMASPSTSTLNTSACDLYTAPSGATYSTSGTYTDVIPNMSGCDSTITINLTVNAATTSNITVSACDLYTAPSGATYSTSGTYTDVIPNMAGCDSTITIDLTVNTGSSSSITASACDIYTAPSGATFTTSGTVTDVIPNAMGCDSTITINLTIMNGSSSSITASACDSYTAPSGAVLTSSGTYTDIIPNAIGCDSTITITLTINTVNTNATAAGATLTAAASGATYQWIDCSNNSPIAGATSQSYTATVNGSYAVIVTQNTCSDTSNCLTVTGIGIAENAFASQINMYPNPTQGNFNIDLGNAYTDVLVTISDLSGRIVYSYASANTTIIPVALNEAAGMYIVNITAGENHAVMRLVKE